MRDTPTRSASAWRWRVVERRANLRETHLAVELGEQGLLTVSVARTHSALYSIARFLGGY
jgi:hypothetical protein